MDQSDYPTTERSQLRRHPERGRYDRGSVHAILDEGLVAHVGLALESGPLVLPMAYGRDGDHLLLHGGVASRLLGRLAGDVPACVCVTLLDGVVLARSAFHSSFNYRSVVAFGTARRVVGEAARRRALETIVEHVAPGRISEVRPMTAGELSATEVVEVAIAEASAKIRSGPPVEPQSDAAFPVWAGVIPLRLEPSALVPAPDLAPDRTPSAVVSGWRRPAARD